MMNLKMFSLGFLSFFLIYVTPANPKVTIHLIGDSTMANKAAAAYPETGWGQVFHEYFTGDVNVSNHAINGYSAKSFILNGKWQPVFDSLKEGDYVFIEFGRNDEKLDKPEGSTLKAFHDYLVRYVNETRAKKAIPVLLTPIMRRVFSRDTIVDTHGGYPNVTRTVAREYNVILIDMHSMSKTMLNSLGDDDSRKLFNWIDSGVNANYPKGLKDNTHLNPYGAHKIAELAIKGVKDNIPGLGKYLK